MANKYLTGWQQLLAGLLLLAGSVQAQSFGAPTTYSTGVNTSPIALAVGDVTGDGQLDVVTSNTISNYSVLAGTGTGSFQTATNHHLGPLGATMGMAMGDVDSDGKLDIILADYSFGTVRVLSGTGTGLFYGIGFYTYPTSNPSGLASVALGDLNNDGKLDIVTANVANPAGNTVGVLLSTSLSTFPVVTNYATAANATPYSLAVADVNKDGQLDVVTTGSGNTIGILLGNGTGMLATAATYSTGTGTLPYGVAIGDINGDHWPDIVTGNSSDTISLLLSTGTGSFQLPVLLTMPSGSGPTGVALSDINGDGRLDIVTANYLTSSISVLLNTTPLAARATLPGISATLHPNPTSTSTTLTLAGLPTTVAQVQATLFDATGRAVGQQQLAAAQGTARADVLTAGLAAGLYILRLTAHDAQGQLAGSLPTQRLSVR